MGRKKPDHDKNEPEKKYPHSWKNKLAVTDFEPFIESQLKTYLRLRCDTFAAGCVAHSLGAWKEITSDKDISTVMGLKIDFNEPPKQFLPACIRLASEEAFVDLEVKKTSMKKCH